MQRKNMGWSDRQYGYDRPLSRDDRPLGTWWLIGVTLVVSVVIWIYGGGVAGPGTGDVLD